MFDWFRKGWRKAEAEVLKDKYDQMETWRFRLNHVQRHLFQGSITILSNEIKARRGEVDSLKIDERREIGKKLEEYARQILRATKTGEGKIIGGAAFLYVSILLERIVRGLRSGTACTERVLESC